MYQIKSHYHSSSIEHLPLKYISYSMNFLEDTYVDTRFLPLIHYLKPTTHGLHLIHPLILGETK